MITVDWNWTGSFDLVAFAFDLALVIYVWLSVRRARQETERIRQAMLEWTESPLRTAGKPRAPRVD